jgi:hypothetical protein
MEVKLRKQNPFFTCRDKLYLQLGGGEEMAQIESYTMLPEKFYMRISRAPDRAMLVYVINVWNVFPYTLMIFHFLPTAEPIAKTTASNLLIKHVSLCRKEKA